MKVKFGDLTAEQMKKKICEEHKNCYVCPLCSYSKFETEIDLPDEEVKDDDDDEYEFDPRDADCESQ